MKYKYIGLHFYFYKDISYQDTLNSVASEFQPSIPVTGQPIEDFPGLKEDALFLIGYVNETSEAKFMARLDPYASAATIRQAIIYALAGKFDNISEEKTKQIWTSGDPSANGIFEGSALDVPWPRIGVGTLIDGLKNLLSFNWIPWWAWASISAVFSVKVATSKRPLCQAIAGVVTAYSGYRAYKKFSQDKK